MITPLPPSQSESAGTAWHEYQPPTDKEKSFKLLDAFVAAGGNFFDTANGYSVNRATFHGEDGLML